MAQMTSQVFRGRVNQEVFNLLGRLLKCLWDQDLKFIKELPVDLRTNETLDFFFCDHAIHHSLFGKRIFTSFLFVMKAVSCFFVQCSDRRNISGCEFSRRGFHLKNGTSPNTVARCITRRADAVLLDELVPQMDVVIDCCDNFETRQAVNAACVTHKVPLVSGAAIRMDGQLAVYDARDDKSPCYACIFRPADAPEEVRCSTMGVLAPLVGVIGTMQAMETVKLITGMGSRLTGRLQMLDGRGMEWNEVRLQRNPSCPVCGKTQNVS